MELNFKQIVAEQREELKTIMKSGWVPREKESSVNKESRLVQIITGVRRSGKSTLAHRALQGLPYAYINFDDERLFNLSPMDLDKLLEVLFAVYGEFDRIILDEIQNVEGWHLFVNRLQRNNFKIILTGSNSRLLSGELATHLTGRYASVELLPFSFNEFLVAKGVGNTEFVTAKEKGLITGYFEQYFTNGGFPEITGGETKSSYTSALFDAIVTRDIIYRHKIRHVRSFREMAVWLAGNCGTEISFNRLKKLFNLGSDNTARNYVSYLEEAWLFLCLPKFSFKKQESLRYRKIYVVDPSFAGLAGSLNMSNKGHLLENLVFLELFRRRQHHQYEIFYFKKNSETDFVIFKNQLVQELIQVCFTLSDPKTRNREIRGLRTAARELNPLKMTIITMSEKQEITADGKTIEVIPITEWLMNQQTLPE